MAGFTAAPMDRVHRSRRQRVFKKVETLADLDNVIKQIVFLRRGPLPVQTSKEIMIRYRPASGKLHAAHLERQITIVDYRRLRCHKGRSSTKLYLAHELRELCLVTLACSFAMLRSFLKTAFATPLQVGIGNRQSPAPRASSANQRAGKTRAPDRARAHAAKRS